MASRKIALWTCLAFAALAVCPRGSGAVTPPDGRTAPPFDFRRDVFPILAHHCWKCHGGEQSEGGLRLDSREAVLAGGDSGPLVIVGDDTTSPLIERIHSTDPDIAMPPGETRLSPRQIRILQTWAEAGFPWETIEQRSKPDIRVHRPAIELAAGNPIDQLLTPYFRRHGLQEIEVVDDRLYARRVYLDANGLLPPPEELAEFLADRDGNKRDLLATKLLNRKHAYANGWMSFWQDLLRDGTKGTDEQGNPFCRSHYHVRPITNWLYQSLAGNKPYDQFVRELLNPPGDFYDPYMEADDFRKARREQDSTGFVQGLRVGAAEPLPPASMEVQAAQNIAQVFLGIRLKCATCHNSFTDSWKQIDTWGLASVYAEQPLEMFRAEHATGERAPAKFLFPELGQIDAGAPRRERQTQLANLVTSPENGLFARTIVNRLWARLFGRGLVEPVDDLAMPAWTPEVLNWLAADLIDHNYNLQRTLRWILTSRAYQMPSIRQPENLASEYIFRGPYVRTMTAEQMIDALAAVQGRDPRRRAWRFPQSRLTEQLGRPDRQTVTTARDHSATKLQALELINGQVFYDMVYKNGEGPNLVQGPVINRLCPVSEKPINPHIRSIYRSRTVAFASESDRAKFNRAKSDYSGRLKHLNTPLPTKPCNDLCPVSGDPISDNDAIIYRGVLIGFAQSGRDMTKFVQQPERYFRKLAGLERALSEAGNAPIQGAAKRGHSRRISGPDELSVAAWAIRVYQHTVCRAPTPKELALVTEFCNQASDQSEAKRDLLWAVLMLPEFRLIY